MIRMTLTGAMLAAMASMSGCAPAPPREPGVRPPPVGSSTDLRMTRPGSLRQAEISVRMAAGVLRVELTPLAPWALEATAPDTRERLSRLAEASLSDLEGEFGEGDPTLFLVSFSSSEAGVEFHPDDLHLISRGLRERPTSIRPITPEWGSHRLEQQASQMAVYVYSGRVELSRELIVTYQGVENTSWSSIVPVIEAERGRIGSFPFL